MFLFHKRQSRRIRFWRLDFHSIFWAGKLSANRVGGQDMLAQQPQPISCWFYRETQYRPPCLPALCDVVSILWPGHLDLAIAPFFKAALSIYTEKEREEKKAKEWRRHSDVCLVQHFSGSRLLPLRFRAITKLVKASSSSSSWAQPKYRGKMENKRERERGSFFVKGAYGAGGCLCLLTVVAQKRKDPMRQSLNLTNDPRETLHFGAGLPDALLAGKTQAPFKVCTRRKQTH